MRESALLAALSSLSFYTTNDDTATHDHQALAPDQLLQEALRHMDNTTSPLPSVSRRAILSLLRNIQVGSLTIQDTDGTVTTCGSPRRVDSQDSKTVYSAAHTELLVLNDMFWVRLLLFADMGFAESYMLGEVACPDITAFFKLFIQNRAYLSNGSVFTSTNHNPAACDHQALVPDRNKLVGIDNLVHSPQYHPAKLVTQDVQQEQCSTQARYGGRQYGALARKEFTQKWKEELKARKKEAMEEQHQRKIQALKDERIRAAIRRNASLNGRFEEYIQQMSVWGGCYLDHEMCSHARDATIDLPAEASSNVTLRLSSSLAPDRGGYTPDPWIVKSILHAAASTYEAYDHYKRSYDPADQDFRSPEELLYRLHDGLGFGSPDRCKLESHQINDANSGTFTTRGRRIAETFLQCTHVLVSEISSTRLLPLCLLGSIPRVVGAPISPAEAMLNATDEFQSFTSNLGNGAISLAPYGFFVGGIARVLYIAGRPTRARGFPMYSCALSLFTAFGWWGIRVAQEDLSLEATFIAAFFACYASLVADLRRSAKEKKKYLLLSVFAGAISCLLGAALQPLGQSQPRVAAESSVLHVEAAGAYLARAANNGPFFLTASAVIIHLYQRSVESESAEGSVNHVNQE